MVGFDATIFAQKDGGAGSPPPSTGRRVSPAQRIAAILTSGTVRSEDAREATIRKIAALGDGVLPLLFRVAVEERVPETEIPLTPDQVQIVLEAFGRGREAEALAILPGEVGAYGAVPARVTAFELVRRHPAPGGVKLLYLIAEIEGLGPWSRSSGAALFEAALAKHLAGFELEFDALPRRWDELSQDLLVSTVRGVGASEQGRGIPLLVDELERETRATGVFLAQLAKLVPFASEEEEERLRFALREALDAEHEGLRKSAAVTLGRLGDVESIPALVRALESGSAGLRRTAHWSLRRITALSFPDDARRWASWYEAEQEWLAATAPRLLDDLQSPDDAAVAAAARELSLHPLHRERYAPALTVLLDEESETLRVLACDCLAQLGDESVLDELYEAFAYDVESVHRRAWKALQSLTGLDLPPDPELWREALDARRSSAR